MLFFSTTQCNNLAVVSEISHQTYLEAQTGNTQRTLLSTDRDLYSYMGISEQMGACSRWHRTLLEAILWSQGSPVGK